MKILSLAPRYSKTNSHFGHWTIVQDLLLESALKNNSNFQILVDKNEIASDFIHPVLEVNSIESLIFSLEEFLTKVTAREEIVVFVYEASIELTLEINKIAKNFQQIIFLLNLHYPEGILAIPGSRMNFNRLHLQRWQNSVTKLKQKELPKIYFEKNLRIITESETRTYLAEAFGFPVVGTWPGISQVADANILGSMTQKNSEITNDLRILIPISSARFNFKTFFYIFALRKSLSKMQRINFVNFQFIFGFDISELPFYFRLYFNLDQRGIYFQKKHLDNLQYIETFFKANVVWLPYGPEYITHSSGKTLDSLCSGKFLISKSGTYPAKEYSKWFSGFPTYSNLNELKQIFYILETLLEDFSPRIKKVQKQILESYSSNNALHKLMEAAKSSPREYLIQLGFTRSVSSSRLSYFFLFVRGDLIIKKTIFGQIFNLFWSKIR